MRWPLVVGGGAALIGAVLLVTAPRGEVERAVPVATTVGEEPVAARVVVDTDRGEIRTEAGPLGSFVPAPGVRMALRGDSGAGIVTVRVTDPAGDPVVRDTVGPDASFDLSAPVATDVDVAVTASPATVPAPGGQVLVRLELTLRSGALDPLELDAAYTPSIWAAGPFGPEEEALGTFESLASLGAPRPDGCAEVLRELPARLHVDVPVVCTFVVDVVGEPGDEVTGELDLIVAGPDLAMSVPGAAVTIRVTDPAAPDEAPPDEGTPDVPGEPAEPPLHGVLFGDAGGVYVIDAVAEQGSRGFRLELWWFEPAPPVGATLAVLWLVSGVVALEVGVGLVPGRWPRRRAARLGGGSGAERVAGTGLGLAGFALVAALWGTADRNGPLIVGGAHAWYWTPGFLVLGVGTLVLVAVGALLASPGLRRVGGRRAGLVVFVLGVVVAAVAVLAGIAGFAYGTEGATYYAGDYLLLAAHVQGTVLAAVLLAVGALLRGTRPSGPREPEPIGARPARR